MQRGATRERDDKEMIMRVGGRRGKSKLNHLQSERQWNATTSMRGRGKGDKKKERGGEEYNDRIERRGKKKEPRGGCTHQKREREY